MKSGKLVVNASPIISLAKIGCADFLLRLHDQLVVPEGVFQEITAHKEYDQAVEYVRLKRSGAWWLKENSNKMLALRCAIVNNTFDQIFSRQVTKEKAERSLTNG